MPETYAIERPIARGGLAGPGIPQAPASVAHLWLNLQKRYDLRRAEQELGEKIRAIPTLEVA
jgi:hypothetical protein